MKNIAFPATRIAGFAFLITGLAVGILFGIMADQIPAEGVPYYGYLFRSLALGLAIVAVVSVRIGFKLHWLKLTVTPVLAFAIAAIAIILAFFGLFITDVGQMDRASQIQDLVAVAVILVVAGALLIIASGTIQTVPTSHIGISRKV